MESAMCTIYTCKTQVGEDTHTHRHKHTHTHIHTYKHTPYQINNHVGQVYACRLWYPTYQMNQWELFELKMESDAKLWQAYKWKYKSCSTLMSAPIDTINMRHSKPVSSTHALPGEQKKNTSYFARDSYPLEWPTVLFASFLWIFSKIYITLPLCYFNDNTIPNPTDGLSRIDLKRVYLLSAKDIYTHRQQRAGY